MSGRLMDHVINRVKRLKLTTVMLAVLFLATAAHAADLDASKPLTRIAFGSCNKPELDQSMWSEVLDYKPQLWVWLGDIVYADHRLGRARFRMNNLSVIADRYATQKQLPLYSQVRESAHVIGIWDDHDYGINDGNRHMPLKEQVRDILLDFLDVPGDAAVRSRQGAYQSYSFGPSGQRVKIILCDGRYFKDKPASRAGWSRGEGTTLLGEEQWEWLQAELTDSDAQLHVIGSGTQIIPTDKSFAEKWENFPVERLRLLHAVRNSSIPTVLLSGDVHLSELLASHLNGTPLYELTASGMTHSWATHFGLGNTLGRLLATYLLPSAFRLKPVLPSRNFGSLTIDWDATPPRLALEAHDLFGNTPISHSISFDDLRVAAPDVLRMPAADEGRWRQQVNTVIFVSGLLAVLLAPLLLLAALCYRCFCSRRAPQHASVKKD